MFNSLALIQARESVQLFHTKMNDLLRFISPALLSFTLFNGFYGK